MSEGWVDGELHASDGTRHTPEMVTGVSQPSAFEGEWQEGHLRDIAQLHREHVIPDTTNDTPYTHFSLPAYDAGKTPTLDSGAAIRSGKFRVPSNAVLVSRLNPRIARVWAPAFAESNAVASTEFLVLTPRSTATRAFLYFLCSSPQFWERMVLSVTGTTGSHQRVNRNDAMTLAVRFPKDAAEQRAIAAVLSDVDELIGSLEALIAKKRAIKQAAMQQLLTGRTRLPGFGGEWETQRLGDHLKFLRHGAIPRSDLTTDSTIRYLHYGDIHKAANVYLNPNVTQMPTLATDRARLLDRLDDGDLVFVDASEDIEGVGKSVELEGLQGQQVVSGLHTIAVRFSPELLADGFKAYLQSCPAFDHHLRRLAAGTKVYATNRAHIASAEIPLPPLPEQRAIATVLSDMDAEITALERRLDKTRAIKQGMMQQLLTGSIRLPIPDADTEDDHAHDA